jgi:tungstate transport system ATP-binding protein
VDIYHIQSLDHFYGDKQVLSIDELSIPSAGIVGLIGPNGSGKSTFLKLLSFIKEPTYGDILFMGQKVETFSKDVRYKVALLPQEPYLMHRTVFENVAYGLKIQRKTRRLSTRVEQALSQVGLDSADFVKRRWNELSGGEAQRVALAARLILRPRVLLLDEPTASVDAESAELIRKASLEVRQKWGTTLVVATHDWQWLYETCDDVLHLIHGRLLKSGLGCAVTGPWKIGGEDHLFKELADGQKLIVSKPTDEKLRVILDPAQMTITLPDKDTLFRWKPKILNGVVTRLFLEMNGETVQTAIKVAELVLTIRLERQQVTKLGLQPGSKVSISYDPKDIEWQ